ncbi:antibiotic biosynthesis monooxygenase [Micromonospora phytophila]|uniref:antibiotic biosynthesis monooxygenase family protein n=1 Tax=Micromonospora phytophila TaxID=709888 RepID=UPI00203083C8|nr:antibiotic biosynthesis monooxygenase family protein [Micromonospora phytophila]MCM0675634.1 antibiotic biosynthesis monooxygenase [Micromonospora phytophila]
MVLEVALIDVIPGHEDEFAAAYAKAKAILTGAEGCRSVRMTRGIESESRFVLLVEWDSVEAHEEQFRATERFQQWRALIGAHFANPPRVEHFVDVPA